MHSRPANLTSEFQRPVRPHETLLPSRMTNRLSRYIRRSCRIVRFNRSINDPFSFGGFLPTTMNGIQGNSVYPAIADSDPRR